MAQDVDRNVIRETLLTERAQLERDIYERTEGDQATVPVDPTLDANGGGSHEADDADALSDFERNQATIRNSRAVLQQVNTALGRLDNGTYGICERCGKPIGARRLEALPYATLCIEDQALAENAMGE